MKVSRPTSKPSLFNTSGSSGRMNSMNDMDENPYGAGISKTASNSGLKDKKNSQF